MIVLYKGARGKGKNLSLVKDALKFAHLGYRILSNFSMTFGETISSEEVLALNKGSNLFNCVLVLDELQLFFDSRNFSREENKSFSNFIQQTRKRNIHILGATQYLNTIDLRLRQNIDVLAFPDFDVDTGYCSVRYVDLTLLEDIEINPFIQISPVMVVFNAKQCFDLYNTYEMLK